jgi:hypothetical protein
MAKTLGVVAIAAYSATAFPFNFTMDGVEGFKMSNMTKMEVPKFDGLSFDGFKVGDLFKMGKEKDHTYDCESEAERRTNIFLTTACFTIAQDESKPDFESVIDWEACNCDGFVNDSVNDAETFRGALAIYAETVGADPADDKDAVVYDPKVVITMNPKCCGPPETCDDQVERHYGEINARFVAVSTEAMKIDDEAEDDEEHDVLKLWKTEKKDKKCAWKCSINKTGQRIECEAKGECVIPKAVREPESGPEETTGIQFQYTRTVPDDIEDQHKIEISAHMTTGCGFSDADDKSIYVVVQSP